MPKQFVICGRPVPRVSSRRVSVLLASLAIFAVFSLLFTAPSSIPGPSLSMSDRKFSMSMPKWKSLPSWNPFKAPAHAPVRQANDTDGQSTWFSDWRWLAIPFSSSYTLDENRALLPVMPERRPIYCYYDTTIEREPDVKMAESDILVSWRRAWWAQGFKPIILSDAEAMNNPLYEQLQRMADIKPELKTDAMRWLAWENMGGGLLSHHQLFPMAAHEDLVLQFLRRGEFESITYWDGLRDGLLAGSKQDITVAIKAALGSSKMKDAKDFLSAVLEIQGEQQSEHQSIRMQTGSESLAYYDANVLQAKYDQVAEMITQDHAPGLRALDKLINSHLHLTWQNSFNKGIAVLKPLPHHTTTMVQPAVELANRLQKCVGSPIQSSCPPNNPKCAPCVSATPLKISSPSRYRNTTGLYTIGTVPHPYTLHTLNELRDNIDIPWVRRKCPRDAWLAEVTKEYLGTGRGGAPRVLRFKEAVAAEFAASRSIWLPAEQDLPDDLDWHFGFDIPTEGLDTGRSETPVPGPERRPQPVRDPADGPVANPQELEREPALLRRAKDVIAATKDKGDLAVRNAIEAWNLADTEAWKFARAFLARERVERGKFAEEESKFAEGVGTEKSGWTNTVYV